MARRTRQATAPQLGKCPGKVKPGPPCAAALTQAGGPAQPTPTSPTKLLGGIFSLVFIFFSPLQKHQQQNLKTCKAAEPSSSPCGWGEHPPPTLAPISPRWQSPVLGEEMLPTTSSTPATRPQLQLGASLRQELGAELHHSSPAAASPAQPAWCLPVCLASAQPLPASPRIAISGLLCKSPPAAATGAAGAPALGKGWWWAPRAAAGHPGLPASREQLQSHLHLQRWGCFPTGRVEWESEVGEHHARG